MNFLNSPFIHGYLYSPNSWIHKQRSQFKVIIIFLHLTSASYMPLYHIYVFIFIYTFMYRLIYLPPEIQYYFRKIFLIFSLFILVSIQNKKQILKEEYLGRQYIYLRNPINYFLKNLESKTIECSDVSYGLSLSLVRLLSINFLHLIITKLLSLTTSKKDIINCYLNYIPEYNKFFMQRINFEVQVSIHFFSIIMKEIEIMHIAYSTRSIKDKKSLFFTSFFNIYFFHTQQFIENIYNYIYSLSNTIYYKEIFSKNLNVVYSKIG